MRELTGFARRFAARTWAVEGCNGVGKHLAQRLVAAGEHVVDVSTRQSSLVRVFAGGNGRKSDDTDALSIALVGLRSAGLPVVRPDGRAADVAAAGAPPRRAGRPPAPRPPAGCSVSC